MKKFIILLLMSQMAYGQDAVQLGKGQLVPFDGFLLTKERVVELKNNDLDFQYLTKENVNLKLINTDYEKRLALYIDQNDKLAKRVTESETSLLEKTGMFVLGAVITGGLAWGMYRIK